MTIFVPIQEEFLPARTWTLKKSIKYSYRKI